MTVTVDRPSARRFRAVVAWVTAAVVAVVAVGALVATLWYRRAYHLWPGQSTTDRLHWCGRDYQRSAHPLTAAQLARLEPAGVTPVFRFPPLGRHHQVYAHVTPAAERNRFRPPTPCAMGLYLKKGPDDYTGYELLGGA